MDFVTASAGRVAGIVRVDDVAAGELAVDEGEGTGVGLGEGFGFIGIGIGTGGGIGIDGCGAGEDLGTATTGAGGLVGWLGGAGTTSIAGAFGTGAGVIGLAAAGPLGAIRITAVAGRCNSFRWFAVSAAAAMPSNSWRSDAGISSAAYRDWTRCAAITRITAARASASLCSRDALTAR